jgi:hypothetical protein
MIAPVAEFKAGTGNEVDNRARHQNLFRTRNRSHAGRRMDGNASDISSTNFAPPGVKPAPYLSAQVVNAFTDGHGAPDGSSGPVEGGEYTIARRVHLAATMPTQLSLDHRQGTARRLATATALTITRAFSFPTTPGAAAATAVPYVGLVPVRQHFGTSLTGRPGLSSPRDCGGLGVKVLPRRVCCPGSTVSGRA